MSLFTDKTLMITGGTGSFGNTVLDGFLKSDIGEIRIFSRDEKKQDDMRHEYQAKFPEYSDKINFYIHLLGSLLLYFSHFQLNLFLHPLLYLQFL